MLLVVLGNNSGLSRAKNKHQVPCKKQKAIRSNKKNVVCDLMTDLGLVDCKRKVIYIKYGEV